jgi:uncharacterized membrane protein YhhN
MSMSKNSLWLFIYILICVVELVGEVTGNMQLVYYTKPFLMPALAAWFFMETRGSKWFLRSAVLTALAFSTVGDILLLLAKDAEGQLLFLLGLVAFLFAHLFYTGGFILRARKRSRFLKTHYWWGLPFLAYAIGLLVWLRPGVPHGLFGPVAAYALAITCTALSAVNLYPLVPRNVFFQLLAGAVLFVLSDSLIAVSKFGSVPVPGFAIMLTYVLGQGLLVSGARMPASYIKNPG